MAIDPNILLGSRGVEAPDLLQSIGQVFAIRGAKRQDELGGMQLEQAKTAQAEQGVLNKLFQKHTVEKDGKKGLDDDAVLSDLFTMGRGDLARKYQAQTLERDTAKAAHEKALADGDLAALKLEAERTSQLSGLAAGALEIENVPDPILRAQAWDMFKAKALEIDPDMKDHIPESFDANFLRQGYQAGLTEEERLKRQIQEGVTKADADFNKAIPQIEKAIKAAGQNEQALAQIQRDIAVNYPNSKIAQEYAKGLPKSAVAKGGKTDMATFRVESALSNEFTKKVTPLVESMTSANQIRNAMAQNNPLDAYNAVVQFVKLTDPGVSAREGEVSAAGEKIAGGALGKLARNLQNLKDGTLTPEMRKTIEASVNQVVAANRGEFEAHKKNAKKKVESYNKRGYDLDYDAVVGDYDATFAAPAEKPVKAPPGSVVINGGKRYSVGADGQTLTLIK